MDDQEPATSLTHEEYYNLEWMLGGVTFRFNQNKSLLNRWKWWVSTKLFLPGEVRWKDAKGNE